MAIPQQTVALLKAARQMVPTLPADAVLLLAETNMDWDAVRDYLGNARLLVVTQNRNLQPKLADRDDVVLVEVDGDPIPTQERMSLAILKAVAAEQLTPGANVVVLYNGIAADEDRPEPIDSLSVIHLSEHLERLSAADLRRLDTQVPLETLRLVVDLATEIGREGREGQPVGALFVVGDTRKVMAVARPMNFNPFRGYSRDERDLRDRQVREQIKEMAQLDGAIIIGRDGIAVAACMHLDVPTKGVPLAKGLGTRHAAAASISQKTQAIAVVVSQSSGTVRLFQKGEVVLHIEPLARPLIWQPFRLETQEEDADSAV
jgi:DNA integrity scanning protein DisA with diadenylate cyclase activity